MQKTLYGVIAVAALVVIDRFFKAVALYTGATFGVKGLVEFDLFLNGGIAFGLPLDGPAVWIPSALIILIAISVAAHDLKAGRHDRFAALMLFAGGAASNLWDRFTNTHVVDYVIFFGRSAVNLADGMILAGAIWLLLVRPKRTA